MTNEQFKSEIVKAFADAGYIRIHNCIFTENSPSGIAYNYKIKVRANDKVIEIELDTSGREEAIKVLPVVIEAKESYPKKLPNLMIKAHGDMAFEKASEIVIRACETAMKPNAEYKDVLHYYQYKNVVDDIKKLTF